MRLKSSVLPASEKFRANRAAHEAMLATVADAARHAAACMHYASKEAMVVEHKAVQAMGGMGFMNETPVARIFRDAKLIEIGAGASEIRRKLIGWELMGRVG